MPRLANQADINFFAALLLTDDSRNIVDFIANFSKPFGVVHAAPERAPIQRPCPGCALSNPKD
jgi:hypothetical protein